MELRQLEYFAAVARHGHFGRAAQDVYVTQSALSQQIGRLEDELGLTLLVRSPKGVELTPAGVDLLDHANAIMRHVDEAQAAIDEHRDAARGMARVAATPHDSRGLPDALASFHCAFPRIQLALRHAAAAQVVQLLRSGAVDVAVLAVHGNEPQVPAGIDTRIISEEPLRLIGAPGGSLAGRRGATINELRGVPVILPERGTALRELLAAGFAEAGFSPLPFFETSDPRTIRRLAGAGLGVSAIPVSWLEDPGPMVGIAEFADPTPTYRVALLAGSDGRRPVRDLLVEHLVRHFAAGLDDVAAGGASRSGGRALNRPPRRRAW